MRAAERFLLAAFRTSDRRSRKIKWPTACSLPLRYVTWREPSRRTRDRRVYINSFNSLTENGFAPIEPNGQPPQQHAEREAAQGRDRDERAHEGLVLDQRRDQEVLAQ